MLLWSLDRLAHVLHAVLAICIVLFWSKIYDDDDDVNHRLLIPSSDSIPFFFSQFFIINFISVYMAVETKLAIHHCLIAHAKILLAVLSYYRILLLLHERRFNFSNCAAASYLRLDTFMLYCFCLCLLAVKVLLDNHV